MLRNVIRLMLYTQNSAEIDFTERGSQFRERGGGEHEDLARRLVNWVQELKNLANSSLIESLW